MATSISSCRILLVMKTDEPMILSWRRSAGSSLTCYFLDMWKTPTLENHFIYLVVFLGQFMLRLA